VKTTFLAPIVLALALTACGTAGHQFDRPPHQRVLTTGPQLAAAGNFGGFDEGSMVAHLGHYHGPTETNDAPKRVITIDQVAVVATTAQVSTNDRMIIGQVLDMAIAADIDGLTEAANATADAPGLISAVTNPELRNLLRRLAISAVAFVVRKECGTDRHSWSAIIAAALGDQKDPLGARSRLEQHWLFMVLHAPHPRCGQRPHNGYSYTE